ncbi:endo-1,4-beta-xylanase [Methylobacterium sp. J-076]|uniref:endo-1,4-beta-xylanase n=1 Tax=Methylobacterium sp. J-076 TaxID=2836655 RepID=UPI001FB9EFF2|nr:endo-1,4-beta-xylanase [Methylobacterium sp. J-076]MCJ2015110.1 endo-1,4-beta-xylanase [Methylobacterium sp. J-076]
MAPVDRRAVLAGAVAATLAPRPAPAAGACPAAPVRPSLATLASQRGILFGMGLTASALQQLPRLRAVALAESGMLVPGIELKWAQVEPQPGRFDFAPADRILDEARQAGLKARGHALLWHEALPAEVAQTRSPAAMAALVRTHIRTVCARYAGLLHSWDVVNEAIEPGPDRPQGLRRTPFFEALGEGYIDRAFALAAEADASAILTLNEYDLELDTPWHASRRAAMLELLNRLVRRNVPVRALGIQGHLAPGRPGVLKPEIFAAFLRDVASLGLTIFITEFDVVDRDLPAPVPQRDAAAAQAARDYLAVALAEPAVTALVTWGVSDADNWVDGNDQFRRRDGLPARPNPYDDAYCPKPLRGAIADALRAAPDRRVR